MPTTNLNLIYQVYLPESHQVTNIFQNQQKQAPPLPRIFLKFGLIHHIEKSQQKRYNAAEEFNPPYNIIFAHYKTGNES